MSWATHHSRSERYARLALLAARNGSYRAALKLYRRAAEEEALALSCLRKRQTQMRGETAVRVVSLWLNAGKQRRARLVSDRLLKGRSLPDFATAQLRAMFIGDHVLLAKFAVNPTASEALVTEPTDSSPATVLPAAGLRFPGWVAQSPPQLTTLTPNSNSSAIGSGDINDSTLVQFMTPPNAIQLWTAMTSDALKPAVLSRDMGNGTVTFKQGMSISFYPTSGGAYYVFMNGNIVDNDTNYTFTNQVVYTSPPAVSKPAPS